MSTTHRESQQAELPARPLPAYSNLEPPRNEIRRRIRITPIRQMRRQDRRRARTDQIANIAENLDIRRVGVGHGVVAVRVAEEHDRADVGGFGGGELVHGFGDDLGALAVGGVSEGSGLGEEGSGVALGASLHGMQASAARSAPQAGIGGRLMLGRSCAG
jgi:hypothetical protein